MLGQDPGPLPPEQGALLLKALEASGDSLRDEAYTENEDGAAEVPPDQGARRADALLRDRREAEFGTAARTAGTPLHGSRYPASGSAFGRPRLLSLAGGAIEILTRAHQWRIGAGGRAPIGTW
ncbi:MAG: hypothetical protein OXU20_33570 [Myxococcales bacterium]|nr:hypothetical protein [Myxococcales bacterium]